MNVTLWLKGEAKMELTNIESVDPKGGALVIKPRDRQAPALMFPMHRVYQVILQPEKGEVMW